MAETEHHCVSPQPGPGTLRAAAAICAGILWIAPSASQEPSAGGSRPPVEWQSSSSLYQQANPPRLAPVLPAGTAGPAQLGNFLTPHSDPYAGSSAGGIPGLSPPRSWTAEDLGADSPFLSRPQPAAGFPQDPDTGTSFDAAAFDTIAALDELDGNAGSQAPRPTARRTVETSGRIEVIRQRYPDGKVQVERQVTQDRDGNYLSHGTWKLFSPQAATLAEGSFQFGLMEGPWQRWHPASREGIFALPPFDQFEGPFLSTINFTAGQMDGLWQIHDSRQRKIMEIPYELGRRQGTATWWWPNGTKMREIRFDGNLIDGFWMEWDQQGKVTRREEYLRGRPLIQESEDYRPGQRRAMAWFIGPRQQFSGEDSWWEARPAAYTSTGQRVQHGPVALWYQNGQPMMQGQYRTGQQHGTFTWWHPNGQKKLSGQFSRGKKTGTWTWWYESGMKATEGRYRNDEPSGLWIWWDEDGQVTQRRSLGPASVPEHEEDLPPARGHLPQGAPPAGEPEEIDIGASPVPPLLPRPDESGDASPDLGPDMSPGDRAHDPGLSPGGHSGAAPPPSAAPLPSDPPIDDEDAEIIEAMETGPGRAGPDHQVSILQSPNFSNA